MGLLAGKSGGQHFFFLGMPLIDSIIARKSLLGPAFASETLAHPANALHQKFAHLSMAPTEEKKLIARIGALDANNYIARTTLIDHLLSLVCSPTAASCLRWEAYFQNPRSEFLQFLVIEGDYAPFPDSIRGRERYNLWKHQVLEMDAIENTRFLLILDIMNHDGTMERVFRKLAKVLYHDTTELYFTGNHWSEPGAVEEEDVEIVEDSSSGVMKELIGGRRVRRIAFKPFLRTKFHANYSPKTTPAKSRYVHKNNGVSFAPFRNTCTTIDLSHAQILHGEMVESEQEHCLLHTLKYYGVPEDKINTIGMRLISEHRTHVAQRDFKMIAEFLGARIVTQSRRYIGGGTDEGSENYYGDRESSFKMNFGIVKNHVFPNINVPYTLAYVKNYEKIERYYEENPDDPTKDKRTTVWAVQKDRNSSLGYKPRFKTQNIEAKRRTRKVSTLSLINTMFQHNLIVYDEKVKPLHNKPSILLKHELIDNEQRSCDNLVKGFHVKKRKEHETKTPSKLYFACDLEAFVSNEHEAFLAAAVEISLNYDRSSPQEEDVLLFHGSSCILDMFTWISDCVKQRRISQGDPSLIAHLFFHNLRYDKCLFEKSVTIKKAVVKANKVYCLSVDVHGVHIDIVDSLKIINASLSKFGKTFDLPETMRKVEGVNYSFYNETNTTDDFTCSIDEYLSSDVDRKTKKPILESLLATTAGFQFDGEVFSPLLLYKYYLRFDVLVLAHGLSRFRAALFMVNPHLDVFKTMTIASYANQFFAKGGAFQGTFSVRDNLRSFLHRGVTGGRVHVNEAVEGSCLEGKFAYLDCNSLYPSAILRMCEEYGGFPCGPAKILPEDKMNDFFFLDKLTEYTVEIEISKIRHRQRSIPFIAMKTPDGLKYVNEIDKPFTTVVDRITLKDYMKYHDIEFRVLRGIYWDGTRVATWGSMVQALYRDRKKYKDQGNTVLSACLKLILNSSYGKTIQSCTDTSLQYRSTKNKDDPDWFQSWIFGKFHMLKQFRFIGERQVEVECYKYDDSYNLAHMGCLVLAMARAIMNEVLSLASDLGMDVFYTDTDSFVMRHEDVEPLAGAFKSKFGRQLIGKELSQFHSDFETSGFAKELQPVSSDEVYSTIFMPCGKKLYFHKLEICRDGKKHNTVQFKAKGVTKSGIYAAAEARSSSKDLGIEMIYRELVNGDTVPIVLNPPGHAKFVYMYKEGTVATPSTFFTRRLRSKAAQKTAMCIELDSMELGSLALDGSDSECEVVDVPEEHRSECEGCLAHGGCFGGQHSHSCSGSPAHIAPGHVPHWSLLHSQYLPIQ